MPRGPLPTPTRRTLRVARSAVPSPAALLATSAAARPHCLLATPTWHCAVPRPPAAPPCLLPHALERQLLELKVGAEYSGWPPSEIRPSPP
jgi:hypothetical protein